VIIFEMHFGILCQVSLSSFTHEVYSS